VPIYSHEQAVQGNKMSKPWTKFLDRLSQYSQKPIEYWDQFDFLGYFINRTGMQIQPDPFLKPSMHREIQRMRYLIAKVTSPNLRFLPEDYDSKKIKNFIDFCLKKAKLKKITTVSYLTDNKWMPIMLSEFEKNPQLKPKKKEDKVDISCLDVDLDQPIKSIMITLTVSTETLQHLESLRLNLEVQK
jgi:hypothetical protein